MALPSDRFVSIAATRQPDHEILDLNSHASRQLQLEKWPFKLERMWPVMPLRWLRNESREKFCPPMTNEFAQLLTRSARPDIEVPASPNDVVRVNDGTWVCRFPARQNAGMVRVKLDVVAQEFRTKIKQTEESCWVLRKSYATGFFSNKKSGVEVEVQLTRGSAVGMVELSGRFTGVVQERDQAELVHFLIRVMESIKKLLWNVEDRQADFRVSADFPLTLYPVRGDGTVLPPVNGLCRDVSYGGMCCLALAPITTSHVFVSADSIATGDWTILMRLVRVQPTHNGNLIAGRFRTDLK